MINPIWWQEIPLAAVDLEKGVATPAPPAAVDALQASIAEVGLLAFPWLRPSPGGRWQVVTGVKRLLAVAQLGWQRLPARTLPRDTPESHCLLIHLYDNAARGFDLLEQAILAARLHEFFGRGAVMAKFLPYLGLPPSPAHLDRLLALAGLEIPFQQLAAKGRLALTAAASLAAWEPGDRRAVLPFLEQLPLSQSKQEELLEQVALLARREGGAPGAILGRAELQTLLADAGLHPQERTAALRRQLAQWVYPRFSAAREAFAQALGRLGWRDHPRVRLTPPPAFEGPDFHLEIKFRDAPELQQLLAEITGLTQEKDFTDLTRL